ncbi:hypothetical protein T11_1178 [Trichinella zimbabwensis]|uniref:Uncharacterized protein n=1 Tax=Trichinella zimbabwensis TaxID=268475 RepID=A0A0V1GS84_9BILA|nr:hypothetical protein T11_16156 [Trichinella zimbabwensis]KRZ01138.1 hypothetical protein T11_1178 [Trichinella zimbabwensis]
MDKTFDPHSTTQSTSDEAGSKLRSLCLQTVKKNAYSLSASTAEFITCDEKSDNSMETQSAMFDQKTECYLESATSSCEYDQLACAIPQVQSLQLMDAKSQESEKKSTCCPNCLAFICPCCIAVFAWTIQTILLE